MFKSKKHLRTKKKKRKPKRKVNVNESKHHSKYSLRKEPKRNSLSFKRSLSLEHKNPLFNKKDKSELTKNYIYTSFVGKEKKSQRKSLKKTKASVVDKSIAKVNSTHPNTDQSNYTIGSRRKSERFNAVPYTMDKMFDTDSVKNDSCLTDAKPITVSVEKAFCRDNLPEMRYQDQYNDISSIQECLKKRNAPNKSKFSIVPVTKIKVDEPKLEQNANESSHSMDYDSYLDEYKQEKELNKPNDNLNSITCKENSDLSVCSGCEEIFLDNVLVQNIESDEDNNIFWYCRDCFSVMFRSQSYQRALVLKKLKLGKGNVTEKPKPFSVTQKSSSYNQLNEHRKSSKMSELLSL